MIFPVEGPGRQGILHPSETSETLSAGLIAGIQTLLAFDLIAIFGTTALTR